MAQMTPAELEEFQNLSDRYQASLPGSLISEKLAMDVLVMEYAQADPTFVAKTTGLAATYSSYRAVKGDGQCGWRATVFGYFEILLNSGDVSLVMQEKIRFETYADTMRMVGIDYDIIVDMFDYTFELFDKIQQATQSGNVDEHVVLDIMNDENVSNSIVYHFKMVTSAYMQLRAEEYQPFLEMTVEEYRVARIDPTNQEIDQIGLQALTDAVITPAGFSLEVLYLDRSMGDQVTPHSFSQSTEGGTIQGIPSIRLLYRPGHYDLIYKETQHMQVYLQPQGIQHYMTEPAMEPNNNVLSFLYGSNNILQPQAQDTYSMPYNQTHQYMLHDQYQNFHGPELMASNAPLYTANPDVAYPPVALSTSTQRVPGVSTEQSYPSRSTILTPSPTAGNRVPKVDPFRHTPMSSYYRRYQSVPLGQNSSSSATASPAHFQSGAFQPQIFNPRNR